MEAFIALMLIALILVTEFNSLFQPFIVMTSVILSTMGVLMGLLITGSVRCHYDRYRRITGRNRGEQTIVLPDYNNQPSRGYRSGFSDRNGVLRFVGNSDGSHHNIGVDSDGAGYQF